MKTGLKKDILEAVYEIAECYRIDGDMNDVPAFSIGDSNERLSKEEIVHRWNALLDLVGDHNARLYAAGKEDVTIEALVAVAQHVVNFGRPVEISRADGLGVEYRITVEKVEA